MEKRMNLFHRKTKNDLSNEEEHNILDQYDIGAELDWGKTALNKKENKNVNSKKTYCPSAIMFRNLLEGTSFDRRVNRVDNEILEEPEKVNIPELKETIHTPPLKKIPETNVSHIKKPVKKTSFYKPLKKKKFINEKEQNRLKRSVKRVFEHTRKE